MDNTNDLMEIVLGRMDWIHLAQDMDQWMAVVSATLGLHKMWGKS
jgi:hypothetical protein